MMRAFICVLLFVGAQAVYADDSTQQNAMLQSALFTCRQQTANANAWAQEQIAALTVQVSALQKRVQEFEEAAKKQN